MGPKRKSKRKAPVAGPARNAKRAKLSQGQGRAVNVDALPWKAVEVPEMFDDAEGFFGLQVIDGVDIVRNNDGEVEFVADPAKIDINTATTEGEGEEDEFEGFEDEPVENGASGQEALGSDAGAEVQEERSIEGNGTLEEIQQDPEKEEDVAGQETVNPEDDLEAIGDGVDVSAWTSLGLSPAITSSISRRLKFAKPTAIQSAAIPHIMGGHDVIGKAATGSGKTLAFAIPIVEKWLGLQREHSERASESKTPLALIMTPTRELAHQITNHIKGLCAGLKPAPYVCSVTGGLSLQKQQRQLPAADVVIGTPGRLWEVLSSSNQLMDAFRKIRFLVVDEADRLLTEGHFKEARDIFAALDRIQTGEAGEQDDEGDEDEDEDRSPRQTLVFSATFNKNLQQKLAGKGRYDIMSNKDSMAYLLRKLNFREKRPKFIDVNPVSQMAEKLKEGLIECGPTEKDLYLYAMLLFNPNKHTLVFTNAISAARRLTPMLQNLGLAAHALHSQMIQKARLRSIERFAAAKPGTTSVLVATDVAARGLDIPGVEQVIHYHVPRTADMYVHRSGRTARAQSSGVSVMLCSPDEVVPTRRLAGKVHLEQAGAQKMIRELDVDRRIVARLKPRVELAKRIADAYLAREKGTKEDDWVKRAADDLGVEYDSDDLEEAGRWGGKRSQRKKKANELREITKHELAVMKAQLRELLAKKINAGVSTRYITGRSDVDELLKAEGDFLGRVDLLDFDDEDKSG